MKTGFKALVEAANAEVCTIAANDVRTGAAGDDVVLVDLRDSAEIERDGWIAGAYHLPRGMLEFVIDPASPYHDPLFGSGKSFLFYCASGGRSALAAKTAQDMGLVGVSHLGGGIKAWQEAGGSLVQRQ